ncbi:MAG: glycosyltransferase [Acidimicrobiia bacterium]|nr:glycosyltransferase [Acidimicrobiia bacterium]
MPLLSVIVPVFGKPESIEACLASVRGSSFQDYELLVADDGSPDAEGLSQIAARHHARLVRLHTRSGPAAARNAAAGVAAGDVLVFLDSDVTVHQDTLARFAEAFHSDPELDSIMGSYDTTPKVRGVVASFRNLLHAYVHHRSSRKAGTFWTGCGAVRRHRFLQLGGFDETYRRPCIEDVEFGVRLAQDGGRMQLDPAIQITHHKQWSLAGMIRTDLIDRALPWTELMFRHGLPTDLNFRWRDRITAFIAVLIPFLTLLSLLHGGLLTLFLLCSLAGVCLLQLSLFRFLVRHRSVVFAAASFPLYITHLLTGATGFAVGLVRGEAKRDKWFLPSALLLATLIFGVIQIGGGAYQGEFDGYPDEASHFMTGLMIRDYLLQWPPSNLVSWAEKYYLHYPKVTFGHWPPVFHSMEAVLWLFVPPSRSSVLILIGLAGLATALLFYRIARSIVPPPAALFAACVLVAGKDFQFATNLVMAEMLSFLLFTLFLDALIRFLRTQGTRHAFLLCLWCSLALWTKGTGVILIPAAALAPLILRQFELLKRPGFLALLAAGLILPGGAWYLFQQLAFDPIAPWAGMKPGLPWPIEVLVHTTGSGLLAFAAIAVFLTFFSRLPVAAASAAMLLSIIGTSYFVRAISEPRHYMMVMPAILLLNIVLIRHILSLSLPAPRVAVAALLTVISLAPYPWQLYRQNSAGYKDIIAKLPDKPSRHFVSGSVGWSEGGYIVFSSLDEVRPASVFVRASKLFTANKPRLIKDRSPVTQEVLDQILENLAIETILLADHRGRETLPYHKLLKETLQNHPSWRPCAQSGLMQAYCRQLPPRLPREPHQIDLRRRIGRILREDLSNGDGDGASP